MLRCLFFLCLAVVVSGGLVGSGNNGSDHSGSGHNSSESGHVGNGTGHDAINRTLTSNQGKNTTNTSSTSTVEQNGCSSHFQNVSNCLVEAFSKNDARVRAIFEKRKSDLESCFTKNNCKIPSPPNVVNSSKEQCEKAKFEKTKSYVEECVRQKFPNIKLPSMKFNNSQMSHFHPDRLCAILDDSCPASANRTAVVACLEKTFQTESETIKNDYDLFCKDDMRCLNPVPQECRSLFFEVKVAAEKCICESSNTTVSNPECQKSQECSFGRRGMPHPGHGIGAKECSKPGNIFNICGSPQDFHRTHFVYNKQ